MSLLHRTHKSLDPALKVSSLYVFDGLCRAAKHQVSKDSKDGISHSPSGNCTSFLRKVEAILDDLIQDMISTGLPEAKVRLVTLYF